MSFKMGKLYYALYTNFIVELLTVHWIAVCKDVVVEDIYLTQCEVMELYIEFSYLYH